MNSGNPMDAEVMRLLADRQKIAAIKFVRQQTGIGLTEAKAYVDALEAGRDPRQIPMASPGTPAAGGGVGFGIVMAIAAAAIAYWFFHGR